MRKSYRLFLLLGVATASLSSCSRSGYSFHNNVPAYLGSQPVSVTTPVATAAAPTMIEATWPTAKTTAPHRAARSLAHTTARVATVPVAARAQPVKFTHQAIRQELKKQLAAVPKETNATDKSQTTALILCALLGGIGVHQFYLGYTGRGLLRIALALTSFLILPAIANLILYILDIIKIINGNLKPRDGDYGKKFNN